jgi:glycerophosphoryl diester phosphodiesterase
MTFLLRAFAVALATITLTAQAGARPQIFGGRSLLDAHNAYPDEGQYPDRIDRALATGLPRIVIEQDVAYRAGQSVVSHDDKLSGDEPTLERHFFDRVRPIVEGAIKAGATSTWPVLVLHLDFKTNEREHHKAVWDLLAKHRAWLTTAAVTTDASKISPFQVGPLLVLTENGENQERDFTEWAAAGGTHLLFGSIPPPNVPRAQDDAERARILINATPQALIPAAATSYRRWVNFPWAVIEEGGPTKASDWTPADAARLETVVRYAHSQGLMIRFYTLNGHTPAASRGWTASYNFGTIEAARQRWQAAIRTGVDLIATDQYEELAALLRSR